MSTFYSVQVRGYTRGHLTSFGNEFKAPRQLMRSIRDHRIKVFRYKMNNELNWNYAPTERLEGRYRRWKAKRFPGRRIRHLTGAFQASHSVIVYQGEVVEAIDDPKAAWLMEGTKKMTARPLLPPGNEDLPYTERREVERRVTDYLASLDRKFTR